MFDHLKGAESQIEFLIADKTEWKAKVQEDARGRTHSFYRPLDPYHKLVLQVISGTPAERLVKAEAPYIFRLAKGIAEFQTGIVMEEKDNEPTSLSTAHLAAGSIVRVGRHLHTHIKPIQDVFLVKVVKNTMEPDFTKGQEVEQKHQDWAFKQFIAIYKDEGK